MPAYNAARTVAETLESILAQSLPPREVVVVDDGSRDGTLEVLRTFADRVKVKTQPNSGVSTTRNRGVEEAAGEWIAFCDADDVWHP
ncbi:MAG: glycosyltransferase family 2 protein, partial [Acidobacteria bacterium]|nr:glycosyltransferase family 2 protein [Acidobacteriota bacterium]